MEEWEGADREALRIQSWYEVDLKARRAALKKEKNEADIQVNHHMILL